MVEKNPAITLDDDARGIEAAPGSSAFLDWLWETSLAGDDGKHYWFGGAALILKLENVDVSTWEIYSDSVDVIQDPKSIYKIAKFGNGIRGRKEALPGGSHRTWGVTGKVPDYPVATISWDKVEGTFTYKDGKTLQLTNGFGSMSVRQWRPYPSLTPPVSSESDINKEERFQTL